MSWVSSNGENGITNTIGSTYRRSSFFENGIGRIGHHDANISISCDEILF